MADVTHPPVAGTPPPGEAIPNPGTGTFDPKEYVSAKDFGATAALIGGMRKTLSEISAALPGLMTADKLAEFGLVEKDDAGVFKPKSAKTAANPKPEVDPASRELEDTKAKLTNLQKKLEEKELAEAATERDRAVIASLNKAGAIKPERDFVHVAKRIVKTPSGAYVVKAEDKYGAPIDVSIDDFAAQYLNDNPELKRSSAKTGSDTPSGNPGGGGSAKTAAGATLIPKTQWQDMQWMSKPDIRKKFLDGEYARGE